MTTNTHLTRLAAVSGLLVILAPPAPAAAQVRAQVPAGIKPPWTKGIQPISRESYWNAVDCGKQGGAQPACVFWDADLCKNEEFTLAFYTPYKQVAYTVWQAVSRKQPPPTPSYPEAQRTRVVLGIKALRGSQNAIGSVLIKRGGQSVKPATQTPDGSGGTFIFDFAALAPTTGITIELAGKAKTVTCHVDQAVLARFR
jgi:hypothetical protein